MRFPLLAGTLTTVSLLALVSNATAQTFNYSEYEELFGEPVTKSALGIPQRASEAPATMSIITQDDIRRSGVRDIIELLARVPGVDIQRAAMMDGDVGIRGYNQAGSSRLLVMINGRQVYVDHQGYTVWSALPVNLSEIRQIEVVRGPNTALFGFNAVGGVVNIITFNPLYDNVNTVDFTMGNNGYKESSTTQTIKLGKWGGLRLSADVVKADGYQAEQNDRNVINTQKGYNYKDPIKNYVGADGLFQLTPDLQVGFEGTSVRNVTWMRVSSKTVGNQVIMTGTPLWEIQSGKAYFAWNTGYGTTNGQFYITRNGSEAGDWSSYRTNTNMVGQVEHVFKVGTDHAFRTALEWRRTDYRYDPSSSKNDRINYAYYLYSPSASWNWRINDDWSFSTGARLDYTEGHRWGPMQTGTLWTRDDYSASQTNYSYNTALSYQVTPSTTARLSASRGIQFPNLISLASNNGNPRLDPGIVKSYELGLTQKVDSWGMTLNANAFYTKTTDLFSTVRTGIGGTTMVNGQPKAVSGSIGSSHVAGLELSADGKIGNGFTWGVNYTYQRVIDNLDINKSVVASKLFDGATGYTTSIDYEKTTPKHLANLHLGYKYDKWELDGYLNYVSDSYQFFAPTDATLRHVAGHVGLSGRVAYNFTDNLTFAVSGTNLAQKDIMIASNRPVDRQVFATLTVKW